MDRHIKNGDPKKVVLFEDKRCGKETQLAEWRNALEQLTNHLKLVRTEQGGKEILYVKRRRRRRGLDDG